MKTIKLPLILLASIFSKVVTSQTADENMMKYWKHRSQLKQFVFQGSWIDPIEEHGSYVVAEFGRPYANCAKDFFFGNNQGRFLLDTENYSNRCGGLSFGADATVYLGWYIGVLATEYKLLKSNDRPADETLRELWGALKAYERLDRMAEPLYGEPSSLNGFFLRDDVLPSLADKINVDNSPYFEGVGCASGNFAQAKKSGELIQNSSSLNPYDVTMAPNRAEASVNTPSGDQAISLLLGFALVKACVEPNVTYNGESLYALAINYTNEMATYSQANAGTMGWDFKDPFGNTIGDRSIMSVYTHPFALAAGNVTGINYADPYTAHWFPVWRIIADYYAQYAQLGDTYCTYTLLTNSEGEVVDTVPNYETFFLGAMLASGISSFVLFTLNALIIAPLVAPVLFPLILPNLAVLGVVPLDPMLISVASLLIAHNVGYPNVSVQIKNTCWSPTNPVSIYQVMMYASLSNEWVNDDLRTTKAHEWGMEIFPLLSAVLFPDSDLNITTKNKCRMAIENAPCEKFCSCLAQCEYPAGFSYNGCEVPYQCNPAQGWQSTSRYIHRNQSDYSDDGHVYNGLDFLLLYNLYHLKYPEELPYYYSNTWNGRTLDVEFYPNGIVSNDVLSLTYNCWACEQQPAALVTNSIIESTATVSSIDGAIASFDQYNNLNISPTTFYADLTYRAGKEIQLKDGFSVSEGASFHAYIDPFVCINGQLQRVGDEPIAPDFAEHENGRVQAPNPILQTAALFPNPTTGLVTLKAPEAVGTVQVLELTGRVLQTLAANGSTNVSIDLSPYHPGTFLLRAVYVSGKTEVWRVVRQ